MKRVTKKQKEKKRKRNHICENQLPSPTTLSQGRIFPLVSRTTDTCYSSFQELSYSSRNCNPEEEAKVM